MGCQSEAIPLHRLVPDPPVIGCMVFLDNIERLELEPTTLGEINTPLGGN